MWRRESNYRNLKFSLQTEAQLKCSLKPLSKPTSLTAFWFLWWFIHINVANDSTRKRWGWAFPLTYQQRMMVQSVSFSVYLHGLWVSENDIYFYFMPARFKRPFQIFMFSFFSFLFSTGMCYVMRRMSESREFYF